MESKKEKINAERKALDMMMDMVIESDAPEEIKLDFKLLKARNELTRCVTNLVTGLTMTDKYETEKKIKALEYLTLVANGVKQYCDETISSMQEN